MKNKGISSILKRTISLSLCVLFILLTACSEQSEETSYSTDTEAEATAPFEDTLPGSESSDALIDISGDSSNGITTKAPTEDNDVSSGITTDNETDASADSTTDSVTTPSVTAENPNAEKTSTPIILGTVSQASDRVIIYGKTEDGAKITYKGEKTLEFSDYACGSYFYVEVNGSGTDTVSLFATADGKKSSDRVSVNVTFTTIPNTGAFSGRNSRLFLRGTEGFLIGSSKVSDKTLEATANRLDKIVDKIQAATGKDTKLIYLFAPNPISVYYDEQYDYLINASGGKRHSTAASQFVEYMNGKGKNEDIIVPDLLALFDQHKDERIFYRTDTHWSELGAYYAYAEMMKYINRDFPGAKAHPLSDFDVRMVDCQAGDLASMLKVSNMREEAPFLHAKFEDTGDIYPIKRDQIGYRISGINWGLYPINSYINNSALPTAYALSDSYGAFFLPFAGMGFSHLRIHGANNSAPIDYNVLAECKPDYIILNYTDRNVDNNLGIVTSLFG